MHGPSDFFVMPAIALMLASCSTTGPVISGRTQDISPTDIQAAVAALQGSIVDGPVRPAEIEVISHDEIRIHVEQPAPSNCIAMVRVRGSWQVGGVVLVHPRY
jgi:hypothetical protein